MSRDARVSFMEGRSCAAACPFVFHAVSVFFLLLISGCAATPEQNDPAEGGFWRAVQGVSGGQYEERQRRQEADLEHQHELSRRLDQRYQEILHDQAELDEEIAYYQEKLDELDLKIAKAIEKLSRLDTDNEESRGSLRAAEERISEIRFEMHEGQVQNRHDIERIMMEIEEMEQLVAGLTTDFD